jgi:hypothetical protein
VLLSLLFGHSDGHGLGKTLATQQIAEGSVAHQYPNFGNSIYAGKLTIFLEMFRKEATQKSCTFSHPQPQSKPRSPQLW